MKQTDNNPPPRQADAVLTPSDADLRKLATLVSAHAPSDGRFELHVPGVSAVRFSQTSPHLVHAVVGPVLCVVAQGAKSVMLGQEVYEYDASRMLIFSVDLPVTGQVTRASRSEPFLCLRMELDPHRIAELALKVYPDGLSQIQEGRGVYVTEADPGIVNAAARLIELAADPADAELLAPLVVDEILIRLLRSRAGVRVAQIGLANSSMHRIAKAISWLRANYTQPLKVEELAGLAHMSPSSFHQYFKSFTSMSPLHYQKVLRLQEARRLMLSATLDAAAASRQVGYQSASQFSRDYGRFFGNAPARDVARLRKQGVAAAAGVSR
ncbi:MAG: AraC family transcriptional regulator [Pyrinomonadaceae bacterium]